MHTPPQVAAMGIYILSILSMEVSRCPARKYSSSLSFLATDFADSPENSIQNLANRPQHVSTNVRYISACTGSAAISLRFRGGEI